MSPRPAMPRPAMCGVALLRICGRPRSRPGTTPTPTPLTPCVAALVSPQLVREPPAALTPAIPAPVGATTAATLATTTLTAAAEPATIAAAAASIAAAVASAAAAAVAAVCAARLPAAHLGPGRGDRWRGGGGGGMLHGARGLAAPEQARSAARPAVHAARLVEVGRG